MALGLVGCLALLPACGGDDDSSDPGDDADTEVADTATDDTASDDDATDETMADVPTIDDVTDETMADETAGGEGDDAMADGDASEVSVIGVSNLGLSFPFPAAISEGIKASEEQGVTVVELDAQGTADKQASDVQDLISQQPDGVLLLPVDSGVATGLVDQLDEAGVATVAVASQVGDPESRELEDVYPGLVALVTQREVAAGEAAGELALVALPDGGKVATVEGAAGFAENQTRPDPTEADDAQPPPTPIATTHQPVTRPTAGIAR